MSKQMGSFRLRVKHIIILVLLITAGLLVNTFMASANDTYYSIHSPAKNATITTSNPKISVNVRSANELDPSTFIMKVNGNMVDATFSLKTTRKEGTISFYATKLNDGVNKVEVSINDKADPSNLISDSWTFTVGEAPKITTVSPADGSEQKTLNQLSAVITDNTTINWDKVSLKINNLVKSPLEINKETGTIAYNYDFPTGSYTAFLDVTDTFGKRTTKTWKFVVDSSAPEINYLSYFKDGATITTGPLKILVGLKDLIDIKDNVTLKLDGQLLPIDFKYQGSINYYGEYEVTSRKIATVAYEGRVANGNHTLELYTEDEFGNQSTRTWNFTVAIKPEITEVTPLKYGLDNLKPTISAVVNSPNGTIEPESIDLKVNGEAVIFNYDETTGLVDYTPTNVLKNESYHTVNLTASDQTGLSLTREWKFYVSTYKEMDDSNPDSCTTCHDASSFEGSNGVLENVHKSKLSFSGTHSRNNCENCHSYVTVDAGCSQCHDDPEGDAYAYAPHGSTSTMHYQPKNADPNFPLRVTENRELNDCIVCHQPGVGVKGYVGHLATPTRTLNNHDIPELHKTEDTCTQCHAKSLTREHARDGRSDKDNNEMTCKTCHESANPKVVKAITDKTTSCSACHEPIHDGIHSDCKKCHTNSY
jgi:hypothetical protein